VQTRTDIQMTSVAARFIVLNGHSYWSTIFTVGLLRIYIGDLIFCRGKSERRKISSPDGTPQRFPLKLTMRPVRCAYNRSGAQAKSTSIAASRFQCACMCQQFVIRKGIPWKNPDGQSQLTQTPKHSPSLPRFPFERRPFLGLLQAEALQVPRVVH
jgi:hypothetical protein